MKKIAILIQKVTQPRIFGEESYERLRKLGSVKLYDSDSFIDRKHVLDFVQDSDLIITSWQSPKLDDEILDSCPNLLGVIHAAGTIKPILCEDFVKRKIPISSALNEISCGVAETTLGIAIAACKGFFWLPQETQNGLWRENAHKITDFYGIKVGVVGAGNAGSQFIRLLRGFCIDILVYDPYVSEERIAEMGARKCSLEELMSQSKIISIHAPDIPATENMFNRETLSLMQDGAILINTARGAVIDEDALLEVCEKKNVFAVLDVMRLEPPEKDHPFRENPNVVLLPHIAGTLTNGVRRIGKHVCEEAERLFKGEKMKCEQDISKLDQKA